MVSPFLRRGVHNLRILWTPTGEVSDLRGGVPRAGAPIIIDAYAESKGRQEVDMPGIRAGTLRLSGFLCRWVALPEGAGWLDAGTAWSWDTTGLRPPGLLPGAEGRGFWGAISSLPSTAAAEQGQVRILEIGGAHGAGGIGARVRLRAGDEFAAGFSSTV
jgi:hypothetical protein